MWAAQDDILAPGEILHSPAASAIHMRLSGGAGVHAGPSWLAPGSGGRLALAEGAVVVAAERAGGAASPPGDGFLVDLPPARVESRGEVEVAVGGASVEAVRSWLEGWGSGTAESGAHPGPGEGLSGAAGASLRATVFARRGPATVLLAGSGRRFAVPEGRVLALHSGGAFLAHAGDALGNGFDRLPRPPGSRLPAPPGSGALPGSGGPDAALAGPVRNGVERHGPVRNGLERDLASADAGVRARALWLLRTLDPEFAGERALALLDDPAAMVRAATVRVLLDRVRATRAAAGGDPNPYLEGLRRLLRDGDTGVAVSAVRCLESLDDRASLPALREVVLDPSGVRPETEAGADADNGHPEAVRAHAAALLVRWGVTDHVDALGEIAEAVGRERPLAGMVATAIDALVRNAPEERLAAWETHPGVEVRRAVAARTRDAARARRMLGDRSPRVRGAAMRELSGLGGDIDFEVLRGLLQDPATAAEGLDLLVRYGGPTAPPAWAREAVLAGIEGGSGTVSTQTVDWLARNGGIPDRLLEMARRDTRLLRALLASGRGTTATLEAALASQDVDLHRAALSFVSTAIPGSMVTLDGARRAAAALPAETQDQAAMRALLLQALHLRHGDTPALDALMASARDPRPTVRIAAIEYLRNAIGSPAQADALARLIGDGDTMVREAALAALLAEQGLTRWAGPPLEGLLAAADGGSPVQRALVAALRCRLGDGDAPGRLVPLLDALTSAQRHGLLAALPPGLTLPLEAEATVLLDPSPRVRSLALLHAPASSAAAFARAHGASDPSPLVRLVGEAVRATGGDAGARARLPAARDAFLVSAEGSATGAYNWLDGRSTDPEVLHRALVDYSHHSLARTAGLVPSRPAVGEHQVAVHSLSPVAAALLLADSAQREAAVLNGVEEAALAAAGHRPASWARWAATHAYGCLFEDSREVSPIEIDHR